MWETIVIGSGISGLTAAAALASRGRRVLVLEQHVVAGGLTQTFRRQDWTFATGVHYLSGAGPGAGPGGQLRRLMDALTGGAITFAPSANPYDLLRLPGFEFGIPHPESAYRNALHARFPTRQVEIDRWFAQLADARQAAVALVASRGMPGWMAWMVDRISGASIRRGTQRTVAQALADIDDPLLRAVLGARGGDYGGTPSTTPLLEHALVTGAYDHGAWYPVGGPQRFAAALVPPIERAGGEVRLGAEVRSIVIEGGRARGVVVERDGQTTTETASSVVSTIGVHGTLGCLGDAAPPAWRAQAAGLAPGIGSVMLYLGLDGDIEAAGASSANVWLHDAVDVDRRWNAPLDEDAPALFVSFPSLKDPAHVGPPTAEVLAPCDARTFAGWLQRPAGDRDEAYRATKDWIEARLLAQFRRHFAALAPMIRYHEASTPVTQARYVRTPAGSMYGLEMSAARLTTPALRVRTPVRGLLLAGQDVSGPGVQACAIGGLLAAAAIDSALLRLLA